MISMEDGFIYVTDGDGAALVDWKEDGATELKVPPTLGGLPVARIEESAFADNGSLVSVFLPNTIEHIDRDAFFALDSLERIEVEPGSARFFDRDGVLFERRGNEVVLVKYPKGRRALSYTAEGADVLDWYAFANAAYLEELVIGEGVKRIMPQAVEAPALKRLVLPSTIEEGDEGVGMSFMDSLDLIEAADSAAYKAIDGALYTADGKDLLLVPVKRSGRSFSIAEGCEAVHTNAFDSREIEELFLPRSLRKAEGISVNLPSLEAIHAAEGGAFRSCDGVLYSADMKTLVSFPRGRREKPFVVPPFVEEIASFAFYGCVFLGGVILPPSVRHIGTHAFTGVKGRVSFDAHELSGARHRGLGICEPLKRPLVRPANRTGFLAASRAFYEAAEGEGFGEPEKCLAVSAVISHFLGKDDSHMARRAFFEAYIVSRDASALETLVTWICDDDILEEFPLLEDAVDAILVCGDLNAAAKIGALLLEYHQDELAKKLIARVLEE